MLLTMIFYKPSDESLFEIDANGTLTAFNGTEEILGTTVVVVPETVDGIKVTSVGTVFAGLEWLTTIYIPNGIFVPAGAFEGCINLPYDYQGLVYSN